MNINDLRPAGQFAVANGVKMVGYGPAGAGKTPLVNTAPRPVLLACEAGLLSMKDSQVPTWVGDTGPKIAEFFKWLTASGETVNFDTIAVDSISEMSEIILNEALTRYKNPMQAYGEMARTVSGYLNTLYTMPQKHTYLIAKLARVNDNGIMTKRPLMAGQDLPARLPHMFDVVSYIDKDRPKGVNEPVLTLRQTGPASITCRDRSGKLAELEPPDLAYLFNKAMS